MDDMDMMMDDLTAMDDVLDEVDTSVPVETAPPPVADATLTPAADADANVGTIALTEDEVLDGTVAADASKAADTKTATKERRQPVYSLQNNDAAVEESGLPTPDYNRRQMRKERLGYAGTFRLAEGEVVLSMYRALRGKGYGGRVYLTNRRFLMESSLHTELPIERVQGVSTGKFTRVRWLRALFGFLFMLVCVTLVLLFTLPQMLGNWSIFEDMGWLRYVFYGLGGILGIIGLVMFIRSFGGRFVLTILTDGIQQTVSVRSSVGRSDVDVFQAIAFGSAGPDYRAFAANIGARILEIKDALADNA